MTTQGTDTTVKTKAAAWSVGAHILLLLLLFLVPILTIEAVTPVEETGMEVNLGTDMDGSGDDQPMAVDDPAAERNSRDHQQATQQEDGVRDMLRSDDPDAADVNATAANERNASNASVQNNNRRQTNSRQDNNTRQQQQRPRYVYPGTNGPGGNRAVNNAPGTSQGNTTGDGDRGVPGGDPNATNYEGSPGNGNGGIGHNLGGRDISPRQFEAEFHRGGKVTVRVTVDKDGNIISKSILKSPSSELSRIALQKLSQARFSKSNSPEQIGVVTIVFKARS